MSFKMRLFDRVPTADPRMHIRQLGVTIPRPGDARGDSVNVLCAGGRLDALTEFLDERRDKSDRFDRATINSEVAEAQVVNDVPVTEPVIPAPVAA